MRGGASVGGRRVNAPSEREAWVHQVQNFQVDWDRDDFTRVIAGHGQPVLWQAATPCPNVQGLALPQDHDFTCTFCDGTGFLYVNPITGMVDPGHETKMLITDPKMSQQAYNQGYLMAGDVSVMAMPECRLNFFDRLTLPKAIGTYTERVRRQPLTDADRFKYGPLRINSLSWIDRGKRLVTRQPWQPALPGDPSPQGALRLTVDGVQWGSDRPDDNTYYSVSYLYHPRYVVQDLPLVFNQHPIGEGFSASGQAEMTEFPIHAIARLDQFVRDQSRDPPRVVDTNPFPGT